MFIQRYPYVKLTNDAVLKCLVFKPNRTNLLVVILFLAGIGHFNAVAQCNVLDFWVLFGTFKIGQNKTSC